MIKYEKEVKEILDDMAKLSMSRSEWMDDEDWEQYKKEIEPVIQAMRRPENMQILSGQLQEGIDQGTPLEVQVKTCKELNRQMHEMHEEKQKQSTELLKGLREVADKQKRFRNIDLPGGMTVLHNGTKQEVDEHESALANRHNFSMRYAIEQGWLKEGEGFESLSIEQIMEIRKQPEWKNAHGGDE